MRHEPSDSCPPVQQPGGARCPACHRATAPADVATRCPDCRRAVARLASRRRAAAMRLLIAAHPEEWAGLRGLVCGQGRPATVPPEGGGHGE